MQLKVRTRHQSTVDDSVYFTIRTLNQIQRARRDAANLDGRQKYIEALVARRSLVDDVVPRVMREEQERITAWNEKATPDQIRRLDELADREATLLNSVIIPMVLGAALVTIEGLMADSKQIITVEDFIEHAPDALIKDAYDFCEKASGLTDDQQKN